jgi:hypothetical protein
MVITGQICIKKERYKPAIAKGNPNPTPGVKKRRKQLEEKKANRFPDPLDMSTDRNERQKDRKEKD